MESIKNTEVSPNEIDDLLDSLPSKKAAALTNAFVAMDELIKTFPPKDVGEQMAKMDDIMARLYTIRDELRKGLDGEI